MNCIRCKAIIPDDYKLCDDCYEGIVADIGKDIRQAHPRWQIVLGLGVLGFILISIAILIWGG